MTDPSSGRAAAPGVPDLGDLLVLVARGDRDAFEQVYERLSGPVYGLALRVVRDPAQAEEIAQEVLVELWRKASHYRPDKGGATAWALTMAHRRAIDRVRSAQAGRDREARAGVPDPEYDQVAEEVGTRLEHQQVRRCLRGLTETQRESITLAYYGGYTYREVAELLGVGLAAVKTRMRDGLIRLRDCLGVQT
ncbi:sigma-70 family RNA polymerase sigma factor [Actinomadura darangshiensis]|uniref:Sigma-70 family RNA polymerase sigma factor n=1 Tax=Actinomadura darangshiensis TaxID=705336 RepID=A0A4R5BMH2_9ACTN|nr:ECF RNA polymerase sigma factor SigK [Actinomadura darangshiensis]TDD85132.1 sigma-70 family RNA polymerase sigma factor [Actinomadura darangshiensis]